MKNKVRHHRTRGEEQRNLITDGILSRQSKTVYFWETNWLGRSFHRIMNSWTLRQDSKEYLEVKDIQTQWAHEDHSEFIDEQQYHWYGNRDEEEDICWNENPA